MKVNRVEPSTARFASSLRRRITAVAAEHPAQVGAAVGRAGQVDRGEQREQRHRRDTEQREQAPAEPPAEQHRDCDPERGEHREHAADVGAEER